MKLSLAFFLALAFTANLLRAQTPPQISAEAAAQMIMHPQPAVDTSQFGNISAKAEFDPPAVRPGEKTFYRVSVNATENSILWPDTISLPPELRPGRAARGQFTQPDGVAFHPLTEFIYEVTPSAAGRFTISNFVVSAGGSRVEIPAATLAARADVVAPPPQKLLLEISETNLFFGQPFHVRVISPAEPGSPVEGLHDVQFNGGGFMADKLSTRMTITSLNLNGQPRQAFIYEAVLTPLAAGLQTVSAQGFTVPPFSAGPVTITAGNGPIVFNNSAPTTPVLLVSDDMRLNVRPLPQENVPSGFTGAIGKFFLDPPPQLSTNRIRVGDPVHLKLFILGEGDLTRLVPPAPPRSRDWEIIADNPPGIGYTFIPLTDEPAETPVIPFSYFDPATAKYVDLTIPPLPVTVVAEGLPTELPPLEDESESAVPMKLSDLAPSPGKTAASLKPLQLRGWFVCLQFVPVIGFIALWQWDRRRRFLEAHPEIVRRRQARRALRRKKRELQKAASAGDADAFVHHAADAMKISCAPHFPAHPQALVCADVLAQLDDAGRAGRNGETVRKFFAADDAQFAAAPQTESDLLALQSEVDAVLLELEEKL
jgi:hypothetical protein